MLTTLTPLQARIIGVLLEKEITTPDLYPLTLNALTTGCNQKSNREPVMSLTETQVQQVIDELNDANLLFEIGGSRVMKYKHRFCNTEFHSLKFSAQQTAIVCMLLLRGPQTAGELRTRTQRLADFANTSEVEQALKSLTNFNGEEIVKPLPMEPGKREQRYIQCFTPMDGAISSIGSQPVHEGQDITGDEKTDIAQLKKEIEDLKQQVKMIKDALDLS